MTGDLIPLPRDDSIPGTQVEFTADYSDEESCAELLRRWKYETGFCCPRCGHRSAWFLPSRRLDECRECHRQVSLTAGTVMHGSRKPLRLWFLALYLFVADKQGISALHLSRQLGLSYPTAWTWLHKLRCAAGNRKRTKLDVVVEADEAWEGGLNERHTGRPRVGKKKALIAAVLLGDPGPSGRRNAASGGGVASSHVGTSLFEHSYILVPRGETSPVVPACFRGHLTIPRAPASCPSPGPGGKERGRRTTTPGAKAGDPTTRTGQPERT